MPLAILFAGIVIVLVGVRGTYHDFAATLKGDFSGPGNFGYRAGAILMIGVVGYIGDEWRKLSVMMMTLMVIGLLVTVDRDFFVKLSSGAQATPVTPATGPAPSGITAASSDGADLLKTGAAILARALAL